ncbi:type I-E CRISPR-associated protein Cas6/Cse3/CasE [Boseongicola sp. H5]|uniref:type I-E CRISPR-associated protein Cas6/Cse3/CasE n=1 Tax=Boseongicola sp. H5 TaxID=2763261 RepID=UPI001D0A75BD
MTLYLSRLRLKRDPRTEALKALIDPEGPGALDAHHRLIWTLFADHPDRRRDFLWRADGRGRFYALSVRPPAPAPLFESPDVKEFAPDLARGDRLSFVLRANATKALKREGRGERADVVMALLHKLPGQQAPGREARSQRPEQRMDLARRAAQDWLAAQGARDGFSVEALEVQDYSVTALPGHLGRRRGQPQFGILDLSGTLGVTDPGVFLPALARGFGRAKAFGCGLMLIRRAGPGS